MRINRILKSLLIVLLISVIDFNISEINAQTKTPQLDKTYKNDVYKINYPDGWRVDDSKTNNADLFLFSPLNNGDNFSEYTNVLIQDLKGMNMDLEKYKKISENQFSTVLPNSKIHESEIIQSNGKNYYRLSFSYPQGELNVRGTSLCFIRNEKAYMVTFTALETTYDEYKKTGEMMISSFEFN